MEKVNNKSVWWLALHTTGRNYQSYELIAKTTNKKEADIWEKEYNEKANGNEEYFIFEVPSDEYKYVAFLYDKSGMFAGKELWKKLPEFRWRRITNPEEVEFEDLYEILEYKKGKLWAAPYELVLDD